MGSQLMVKSNGQLGCAPYLIIGYDAPRTTLDVSQSHDITSASPLNFNLNPQNNKESSFWKIVLDGDRVKNMQAINLQINMKYFGTEEQAPVAYFLYNCNFGDSCGDEENNQNNNQNNNQQ